MTDTRFTTVLEELARLRGVAASLLVSATDGIVIDSITQIGEDDSRVAALASSLYRRARLSAEAAGLGDTGFMHLEAERGRVCAIGGNELVLVVVTERDVNVGVVRVAMLRAAEALVS